MKSIIIFCLLTLLFFGQACKQNATTQAEENQVEKKDIVAPKPAATFSGGHDNTFLTENLLHYQVASIIGKDPKDNPYAGRWIDLESDGTFKSGTLKKQTHTGKWGYNEQTKVLLLQPDDTKFPTSEWKVMIGKDMIVWVGTATYGNNATQIKLVRSTELPK